MSVKLLCILCASTLPFIFTLNGDFVFDDSEAVVKNKDVKSKSWTDAFSNDFWGTNIKSNLSHKSYRPLTVLSFRVNYLLNRESFSALQFKITNLLCHIICCFLVWKTFESLINKNNERTSMEHDRKGKKWWMDTAYLSTLLFAVHPVHVEAVSGIVGRADLLAALTFFLAFLSYTKVTTKKCIGYLYMVQTVILSSMSMLFKENGVTVLGVCLMYEITTNLKFKHMDDKNKPKKRTTKYLSYSSLASFGRIALLIVVILGLLYGRWIIMGGEKPEFKPTDNPAAFAQSIFAKVATYNYIYFLNLLLLIWPKWLCYDWSMGCIKLLRSFNDTRIIFVLLMYVYGVLLLLSFSKRKRKSTNRLIILAMSLMVIPFLPAANILYPVGFVIAERILYIPSAGYCLLVAIGFNRIIRGKSIAFCKVAVFMFLFLISVYALRSWKRSIEWQNEYNLFVSGLLVCPQNAKVRYNVAKAADANHQSTWAVAEYKEAIMLYPEYYQAMNNLANLLKNQKQFLEAELYLRFAVEYKQDFPAAWMNLGIVLASTGRFNESREAYLTAIKYRKNYPDCYYNLGNLYLEMNETEAALDSWFKAINQNPKHILAWTNLLALMDNTGQIERALKVIPKVLTELPDAPSINFAIANMYGKLYRFGEAEGHFKKVIKLMDKEVQAIHYANLEKHTLSKKIGVIVVVSGYCVSYGEGESRGPGEGLGLIDKVKVANVTCVYVAIAVFTFGLRYRLTSGVLYHRWKRYHLAEDMYRHALDIDPTFKTALTNLNTLKKINSKN